MITDFNGALLFSGGDAAVGLLVNTADGICVFKPKSVISVMMITTLVFVQMSLRFEGAMGFHCNRKTERQMTKRKFVCA